MKKQLFTIILALLAVTGFAQNKEYQGPDWHNEGFFQYDYNLSTSIWNGYNRHYAFGDRFFYGDVYNVGFGLSADFYRFRRSYDKYYFDDNELEYKSLNHKIAARSMQIKAEIFQRIVIKSWGMNWDLGAYGSIALTRKVRDYVNYIPKPEDHYHYDNQIVTHYTGCKSMNLFQYGVTARIGKDFDGIRISLIGYYRLSDIVTIGDCLLGYQTDQPSPWSIGLELAF